MNRWLYAIMVYVFFCFENDVSLFFVSVFRNFLIVYLLNVRIKTKTKTKCSLLFIENMS